MQPDQKCPKDVRRTSAGLSTESRAQTETETETKTNTPSSLTDAQTRGRANETATIARLREIHPLDATTIAIATLRPDWSPELVRAVLARTRGAWVDVVRHALDCALDANVHHPARIENLDRRAYEPTPVPPSLDEWRNAKRCDDHGAIATQCALCRRRIGATS